MNPDENQSSNPVTNNIEENSSTEPSQLLRNFTETYDSLPCGVALFESDGEMKIHFANKMLLNMLGDETTHFNMLDFVSPEFHPYTKADVGRAVESGEPIWFERKLRKTNGDPIYISGSLRHYMTLGEKKYILTTFNDVTELRAARIENDRDYERFQLLSDHIQFSVVDIDLVDNTWEYSSSFKKYMDPVDLSFNAFLKKFKYESVHPEDLQAFEEFALEGADDTDSETKEITIRVKNRENQYRYTRIILSRMRDLKGEPKRILISLNDVNDLVLARNTSVETRFRLDNLLTLIPIGVIIIETSPEPGTRYITSKAREMLGISAEHYQRFLKDPTYPLLPAALLHYLRDTNELFNRGEDVRGSIKVEKKEKGSAWLDCQIRRYYEEETNRTYCYVTLSDISEQVEQEQRLKREEGRYKLLADRDQTLTFDYDPIKDSLTYTYSRDGAHMEEETSEFLKGTGNHYFSDHFRDALENILQEKKEGTHQFEIAIDTARGKRWFRCTCISLTDLQGDVTRIVGRFDDIHRMKLEQIRLKKQASLDPLTGIQNRQGFMRMVFDQIRRMEHDMRFGAYVIFDIDKFKSINDTWGHVFGDEVLQMVAESLTKLGERFKCMSFARIGGDEFTIFIYGLRREEEVDAILNVLPHYLEYDYKGCPVSLSAGVAKFPQDGITSGMLYNSADNALYRVKAHGGNKLLLFSDQSKVASPFKKTTELVPVRKYLE